MKLANRLSIWAVAVCVVIFLAMSLLLESAATRRQSARVRYISELFQKHLAEDLEHSLQRVQESVEHTVLAIKTLPAGTQEQDAANAVEVMVQSDPLIMAGSLTSVVTPANPAESMIYIVQNKQGCKVSQLGGTSYNYTRQDWYLLPLKEKKPVWSTPYCESEAANTIMTTYSYPVKDAQNRITRIITADVSLHELAATTDSIRPYDASVTLLLNYSGGLIDPTDSLDVAGKFKDAPKFFAAVRQTLKGNSEFNNLHVDDTDYIATFTRVPEVQMVICTITPRQAVLAKFTNIRLPLLLFQGIALILLLVAIHFTVRRITRPLDRLTEAARSIGAGNLNTKIPPASSASDINGLRNAMASMQVSIKNLMEISARDAARMAKIEGELDIARKIQRGMLPGIAPAGGAPVAGGSLKIGALLEPARQVSGDLYDHIMVGGRLYFIIGDVSDKGMPAALVMASVINLFRFAADQKLAPAAMLSHINNLLCERNSQNMFMTAVIGVIDTDNKAITLANAGHNPGVIIRSGTPEFLKLPAGLPTGIMDRFEYTETVMPFGCGDMIFFYTDGLTEAEDANSQQFGEERLFNFIRDNAGDSPRVLVEKVRECVGKFAPKIADDITLLSVAIEPTRVEFGYDTSQLAHLPNILEKALPGVKPETRSKANLLLEEVLSNIMQYYGPQKPDGRILVTLAICAGEVAIRVKDHGFPFNPLTQAPTPDIKAGIDERPVGGLGIFLLKGMASRLEYERKDECNILKFNIKDI